MTDIFGMTPRFYSGGWERSCVNGGFGSMDRTQCNLPNRGGIEAAFFFFSSSSSSSPEFDTQAGL